MTPKQVNRRSLLIASAATAGSILAGGVSGLMTPAQANGLAATQSMRGGANNYIPGAPVVERIGNGGFLMTGTVRRAGDGAPLENIRIQIWAHTTEGHERDPHSHGSTLTDANGQYQMDMPQIVPAFGQAHGHLAYDDDDFETVFMRPLMDSPKDKTLNCDFVLAVA
jgi:protocatechuate 3,4-dioxygenase beta subunit